MTDVTKPNTNGRRPEIMRLNLSASLRQDQWSGTTPDTNGQRMVIGRCGN
jgi:hypothetical protein